MASSVSSSTSGSTFQASGLASGMDTASIVDQLVKLESAHITLLQNQQSALKTQLSSVGSIVSKLQALQTAMDGLKTDGALAVASASSNTTFTATPGSGAIAGRYAIQVQTLARAAQGRSAAFGVDETVSGGTLDFTVQGTAYSLTIADGSTLADVAALFRQSGAPVSATVLSDGTSSYLSVVARDTGFPVGGAAGDALAFTAFTAISGATGKAPGLTVTQTAQNAVVSVNGLPVTRSSNTVTDAVPGTTLTLKAQGAQEDLVLTTDVAGTKGKLQQFVTAYNDVIKLVQAQLSPTSSTDRAASLSGDRAVRDLQYRLQRITSTTVDALESGTVRSLADLGVKTARDGSLSIDEKTLSAALTRDPQAVNALFQTATTGLGDVVGSLLDQELQSGTGALTLDQTRIKDTISRLDDQIAAQQARVEKYRATLIAQFTAMEKTISSLKSISAFLTSQDQKSQASSG